MIKKSLLLIFLIFILAPAFSEKITIAPFAVYNNEGLKTLPPYNPSDAVKTEIEKHWFEGLLEFNCVPENKYGIPLTVLDANKITVSENTDFLIFGYIKKNNLNWFAEIKMYDKSKKAVVKEFFASDDIEHYNRLIEILSQNILSGIEEITGLDKDKLKQNEIQQTKWEVPLSAFYWNPIDKNWGNKILGIAGINAGIELYPTQPLLVFKGSLIDFSARLNLDWSIGMNKKDTYPLLLNIVTISLPVFVHIHFNNFHSIYVGFGIGYELEFLDIQLKYENKKLLYQGVLSFINTFGYDFTINDFLKIFTEITFDYHMLGDSFVSIKPSIGVSLKLDKVKK